MDVEIISKKELTALLDRIEQSDALGASSTYARLLRFLVESTRSGTIPKEQAIAEHLLGSNFAKTDTSKIRVYIYHLRKKLDQYYQNQGKEETYVLSIPKGGYKVEFIQREQQSSFAFRNLNPGRLLWPLLLVLIFSLIANALFFFRNERTPPDDFSNSIFWKDFFNDEKPIQVVLGDLFIFSEIDSLSGETRNVRIPDINSKAQFEEYKERPIHKGKQLHKTSYTHLINGSSEWINSLTKLFHPKKEFSIRPSSDMAAQDMHDYNIIFVGMQKTAGIFNTYFDKSEFVYNSDQPNRYLLPKGVDTLTFRPQGDPDEQHTDYGLIAKYPGPNDNTILLFGGLWDTAASESLRNFVRKSKMTKIEEYMEAELGYLPTYFEILIKVSGVNRIGFETEVLYLNELNLSN